MPALVATNVTVSIPAKYGHSRLGSRRLVAGTLTFGDGSTLTYPTAGVPLPAIGVFGFRAAIESLVVYGNNARTTDYHLAYNKTAHKLLMYEEEAAAAGGPLLECDTAEAPAARTYDFVATGY